MNKRFIIVLLLMVCIGERMIDSSSIIDEITTQSADQCYYCSICPNPFQSDGQYVSTTTSATGWCLSKSVTNDTDNDYELGVAHTGICKQEGCAWMDVDEGYWWICCCNRHLCNNGVPRPLSTTTPSNRASTSTISIITLGSVLLMFIITCKNI